jgi:hypothetical protein
MLKKNNTTYQFIVAIHADSFLCCKSNLKEEKKSVLSVIIQAGVSICVNPSFSPRSHLGVAFISAI